jgi:phosphoribosyl-ATP pyrophosphohydrolase
LTIKEIAENKVNKNPDYDPMSKLIEESGELITAMMKYKQSPNKDSFFNMLSEMSDVQFHIHGFLRKMEAGDDPLSRIAIQKTWDRFPQEMEEIKE